LEGDYMTQGLSLNNKGLVTFDRKVRKDAFFLYMPQNATDAWLQFCLTISSTCCSRFRAVPSVTCVASGLFTGVSTDLACGRLVPLLEEWSPSYPGICLYYPSRRNVPAGLRAFIDLVREAIELPVPQRKKTA